MMRALYTAGTGMKTQQMQVDVIANNLANANTIGFKRSQLDFEDLVYVSVKRAGGSAAVAGQRPTGLEVGAGVHAAATTKNFRQGALAETGRQLDIAIDGPGFFQVTRPDGTRSYTRAGTFRRNSNGDVVTSAGLPLEPPIQIPDGTLEITIDSQGTVAAIRSGNETTPQAIGQIELARFQNPAGLRSMGGNLFAETDASGTPQTGVPGAVGFGQLNQQFTEQSNVDTVTELVNLILAQRSYEIDTRAVRASDSMLQQTTQMTR